MQTAATRVQAFRRRIARMLRRAEANRGRSALILKDEASDLLAELRGLVRAEPAVVLDVLLVLLDRLVEIQESLDDRAGFAASIIPEVIRRIHQLLKTDLRASDQRVDRASAIRRLFRFWIADEQGHCQDLERVLFDVTGGPAEEAVLKSLIQEHLRTLPLVLPPARGATADLGRALILSERHRVERLLGEILARHGNSEYSIIVARDHFRHTGDSVDLVACLARGERKEEAISVARRSLSSPRAFQRARTQELLDELLADQPEPEDRQVRRRLEQTFQSAPSAKTFRALKKIVPADQWPRVRSRILGHLHKHQKAPTLLFTLYLEEGDVMEADGLVVTQPVEPEALSRGAARLPPEQAAIAAGWHLFAAHRRAAQKKAALYPQVVADLVAVRNLAVTSGQEAGFVRAMERFRSRYGSQKRLMALLDQAGI